MFGGLFLFLALLPHAKAVDTHSSERFADQLELELPSSADQRTVADVPAASKKTLDVLEHPSIRRYNAADAVAEFDTKVQRANHFKSSSPTPLFNNSGRHSELSIADRNHASPAERVCVTLCAEGEASQ